MVSLEKACSSCVSVENPDHTKQLHRINRIIGQLEGVKRMMEDRRYCPEILTQTRAVSSAVRSLEANILQGHLESCVRNAFEYGSKDREAKIEELVEFFRKSR